MSDQLTEYLKSHPFVGPFKPGVRWHATIPNAIECWLEDELATSEDISPHVTIHRARSDGRIVGVTLWGVPPLPDSFENAARLSSEAVAMNLRLLGWTGSVVLRGETT